MQGTVTGRQGDRIQVKFPAPLGGKALKPANLKIIKHDMRVPFWILDYMRLHCQSQRLGTVIENFLDTFASTDEQASEFMPQLLTFASYLGYPLDNIPDAAAALAE